MDFEKLIRKAKRSRVRPRHHAALVQLPGAVVVPHRHDRRLHPDDLRHRPGGDDIADPGGLRRRPVALRGRRERARAGRRRCRHRPRGQRLVDRARRGWRQPGGGVVTVVRDDVGRLTNGCSDVVGSDWRHATAVDADIQQQREDRRCCWRHGRRPLAGSVRFCVLQAIPE